jgi:membrane protease subunit HflK
MQQVYSNVSKVMIDTRANSSLLYLPLDKLLQQSAAAPALAQPPSNVPTPSSSDVNTTAPTDVRSRDNQRSRDREGR